MTWWSSISISFVSITKWSAFDFTDTHASSLVQVFRDSNEFFIYFNLKNAQPSDFLNCKFLVKITEENWQLFLPINGSVFLLASRAKIQLQNI